MNTIPFLIGDTWVQGGAGAVASTNPATGEINYEVSSAGPGDVDRAVETARKAMRDKAWLNLLPHQRARILARIADLMEERRDHLAEVQMRENGKVLAECVAQANSAIATFRYYAAVCETVGADLTPPRGSYVSMTLYEPVGVVAAITPWNSPLTMEAQKIAPAIAAGNAVIVKPSEVTPTVALEVAKIALEAGLPPGILNVVSGRGDVGAALVKHPGVRMISFTGGTETGRAIGRIAAERMIPVALELGGKSPNIVFADADLDKAVKGVMEGIFEGSGQSCVAGSRLFVQRSIREAFLERLVKKAADLRIGLPTAPESQMGPLASFPHRENVERFVEDARKDGGVILVGGGRPTGAALEKGAFYLPTIIDGLANKSRVCQQEIFGPVLCVLTFEDEADLISQANDSAYGLACGLWTADYSRAWRVARAIEAGTVWINTYKQLSISTPFGGFKDSGIGREKGIQGMRLYQIAKSLYWGLDNAPLAN
jgi:acyl-CoA reductase-like NAD-dependent aldehyde dehydrogenase